MKTWLFILPFLMLYLSGCEKPDPNAYLRDPLYQDFVVELGKARAEAEEAKKAMEENAADMKKAVPQTGQYRFPQKWYYQNEQKYTKAKQMVTYWESKIETRKRTAQAEYLKAFHEKREWPDPKEYKAYLEIKKVQASSKQWDAKQRVKDFEARLPKPAPAPGTGGGHGEAPPAEHGGGEEHGGGHGEH